MRKKLILATGLIISLSACSTGNSANSFAESGCQKLEVMLKVDYPQISNYKVDQIVINPRVEIRDLFPYAGLWLDFSRSVSKTESQLAEQIKPIGQDFDSAAKRDSKYIELANSYDSVFRSWKPIPKNWIYAVSSFDKKNAQVFDISSANGIPWNSTIEALTRGTIGQVPANSRLESLQKTISICRIVRAK